MSFLNPVEELVNYIISHIHQSLLLNRLDSEQLQANISEGKYIIQDIEFNTKSINQNLPTSSLHVLSAKASRMNLQLPSLLKFFESPVKIRFTDLEINLCSAKSSGCTVILPKLEPLTESDDNPGLNLLTKCVGKLLSSINVEVCLLTINILHENDCIQITVPKFSYAENATFKKFRIEGLWISASSGSDIDKQICAIENDIEGRISITTKEVEIVSELPKIMVYLSYAHIKLIDRIISNMEETDLLEASTPDFINTLKAIEEKIGLPSPIKSQKINIKIPQIDIIISQVPCSFDKKSWEYYSKIHEAIKNSHFHIGFSGLEYFSETNKVFFIKSMQVNYYHYADQTLANSSQLFVSANDSYFHDFFKLPSTINSVSELYCVKTILSIDRNNNSESYFLEMSEESNITELRLLPLHIKLNYVVAGELNKLFGLLEKPKNQQKVATPKNFFATIKEISIEYFSDEHEKCWCMVAKNRFRLVLDTLRYSVEDKLEISISHASLWMEQSERSEIVAEIDKIIYGTVLRQCSEMEPQRSKNYYSYFDPSQGFIVLGKTKTSQLSSRMQVHQFPDSELDPVPPQSGTIMAISITSFSLFLPIHTCKSILSLKFPSFPKKPDSSDPESQFIINIQNFSCELSTLHLTAQILTASGTSQSIYCETSEFVLSCCGHDSYSTGQDSLKVVYTPALITVSLQEVVLDYAQFQQISLLGDIFANPSPDEDIFAPPKIVPVKIKLDSVVVLLPINTGVLSLSISDSEATICSHNSVSFKLHIGSAILFASQRPLNTHKRLCNLRDFTLENSFVVASVSCVDVGFTYALGARSGNCLFGENCSRVHEDFYVCHTSPTTAYVLASECSIGTVILHICKDTLTVLSENLSNLFENTSAKEIEDNNKSIYYELPSSYYFCNTNTVHLHTSERPSDSYPNVEISCTTLIINLYSGYSFPQAPQPHMSIGNLLMLKLQSLHISYLSTPENSWTLNSELDNLEVFNYLQSSQIKKTICKDSKSNSSPSLLKVLITGKNTIESPEEIELEFTVSPLKFNIDHYFLEFCMEWMQEEYESPVLLASYAEPTGAFIKKILISPISFSVDYLPNSNDFASLLKIEDLVVLLPEFKGEDFENLDQATAETWKYWLEHLQQQKFSALIGTLSPVVSIKNIGAAVYGLARMPFDASNPVEGAKQGILGIIKVFSLEGLKVCDTLLGSFGKVFGKVRPWGVRSFRRSNNIGQVFKYIQPDKGQLQKDMNKFKKQ